MSNFKINNFDLIRLIAAFQVALKHGYYHLEVSEEYGLFIRLVDLFPGVPIFFFVSGFLISKSYESRKSHFEYFQNRCLRLYPALILCTLLSILSVYATGYFKSVDTSAASILMWIFTQISFLQFYNPDYMRAFSTGVLNGSLWTIAVELQFYVLVPVLYALLNSVKSHKKNAVLLFLIIVFALVHYYFHVHAGQFAESLVYKLISVSFAPWVYMFFVGVFFQHNFKWFYEKLHGKGLVMLCLYLVVSYIAVTYMDARVGNYTNIVLYVLLVLVVFSVAYSFVSFSQRVFQKNDISYGVYIYHMPIFNLFIFYGLVSSVSYYLIAIILTLICASASWFLLEKRSLKFKRHSLNPLSETRN